MFRAAFRADGGLAAGRAGCSRKRSEGDSRREPRACVTWQRELRRVPAGRAPLRRPPLPLPPVRNGHAPAPCALVRFPPSAVRCGGWRELQAVPITAA